jgi:hypothetical protein
MQLSTCLFGCSCLCSSSLTSSSGFEGFAAGSSSMSLTANCACCALLTPLAFCAAALSALSLTLSLSKFIRLFHPRCPSRTECLKVPR